MTFPGQSPRPRAFVAAAVAAVAALSTATATTTGCTPDVVRDPIPEEMQFDPQGMPPRVPEPTNLIVNPLTGRLDFSLAGAPVPADCANPGPMPRAQCEFFQYLQSLDGYPTVTPARAPTSAPLLDPATLTLGANIVVVDAETGAPTDDATVGFDVRSRYLTIAPRPSWRVGRSYWVAVRGYDGGVRAAPASPPNQRASSTVVGSVPQFLLKQETPLTCGAATAAELDPDCPAFALLGQGRPPAEAAATVFQLERIRLGFAMAGAWERVAAAGIPKTEVAVLWGFPIHRASVAELDPPAGLAPRMPSLGEIRIAVQGPVDPATVSPFIVRMQPGSVVVMDLTAAQAGDLVGGFPVVAARYDAGDIVITGAQPFVADHQYGVFFKRALRDPTGTPLVASPVSMLLAARGELLTDGGRSNVSSVSDVDAAMLEAGRLQLATLFDDPTFAALTGITREELVYCFAFPFQVQ